MRRSDILGRFVRIGTTGAVAVIAAAAEASLPAGGMLLPRPRGPARADLPVSTAITARRVPSAIAYGISGTTVFRSEAADVAIEPPAEDGPWASEADFVSTHGTGSPITADGGNSFAVSTSTAPEGRLALLGNGAEFSPPPAGEDPTPPEDTTVGDIRVAENMTAGPPKVGEVQTEPESLEPAVAEFAGLKGICPVTLRDERRAVDANPEFVSIHLGRRYEFSTAAAKAAFDADPNRYSPALGGRDVVLTARGAEEAVGSLKHAGYYHGRLYLFQTQETFRVFFENPRRFVVDE